MNSYRLLACGVVLGLSISGCGKESADKNVIGQEAAPAEQSVLAPGNSAEFHSLAATANIDDSFASAECANPVAGGSACAPVPQSSTNVAEPMTTVETRLAEPSPPSDVEQNVLTEPVNPEDEAIIRDALFTLGKEPCVPDSESGVECPTEPQPSGQVQF